MATIRVGAVFHLEVRWPDLFVCSLVSAVEPAVRPPNVRSKVAALDRGSVRPADGLGFGCGPIKSQQRERRQDLTLHQNGRSQFNGRVHHRGIRHR